MSGVATSVAHDAESVVVIGFRARLKSRLLFALSLYHSRNALIGRWTAIAKHYSNCLVIFVRRFSGDADTNPNLYYSVILTECNESTKEWLVVSITSFFKKPTCFSDYNKQCC